MSKTPACFANCRTEQDIWRHLDWPVQLEPHGILTNRHWARVCFDLKRQELDLRFKNPRWRWLVLAILILFVVGVALFLDANGLLNLAWIQKHRDQLILFRSETPVVAAAAYFMTYVMIVSLWLPGATVMTLLGGALFGFWQGLLLVSFASSIGATIAFLLSRLLLGQYVQRRYVDQLTAVREEFNRNGPSYLFAMRMVPMIPFVLINVLMGLTPIRVRTFYLVSQVGMLAGTAIYVFAGAHLASVSSMEDVLSAQTGLLLILLGLSPIVFKKVAEFLRTRKTK